jgi:tRNA threonylcarbamoyladenosine biosynthesis protein TsaB
MLDARRSEVYAAVFRWENGEVVTVIDAMSIRPEDLLKDLGGVVLFAGEGALLYREMIIETMRENAVFGPPAKMVPSPANVAALGLKKALRGEYTETSEAVPFYVRKSEAEVKWSQKA